MIELIVGLAVVFGLQQGDQYMAHRRDKKIPMFHVGDIIYQFEDFAQYPEYKYKNPRITQVVANGEGFCRGQLVRKFRLPFQAYYKELKKEGELDFCTGEVYRNGKWRP